MVIDPARGGGSRYGREQFRGRPGIDAYSSAVRLRASAGGLLIGLSLLPAACTFTANEERAASTTAEIESSGSVEFLPAPLRVRVACLAEQRESAFRVLCPAALPRATIGTGGWPPASLMVSRWARTRESFYGLSITYGAPYEKTARDSVRNAPNRFLHFEVLGGPRTRRQLHTNEARLLGRVTLGGRSGTLYDHPPYGQAGRFGSHLTFVWEEREVTYAASLHRWKPREETHETLGRLIAGLVPASDLDDPS